MVYCYQYFFTCTTRVIFILVFAIIGVVNIVGFVKDAVKPQDDESAQLQEYAQFLTWVVGVDPASFSDITSANKDDLRNIAICSLMNDGITTSTYTVSEKGLTVPASDVALYYYSMFGQDTSIVHANVVGYGKSKGAIIKGYDADLITFDDDINIKDVFVG